MYDSILMMKILRHEEKDSMLHPSRTLNSRTVNTKPSMAKDGAWSSACEKALGVLPHRKIKTGPLRM